MEVDAALGFEATKQLTAGPQQTAVIGRLRLALKDERFFAKEFDLEQGAAAVEYPLIVRTVGGRDQETAGKGGSEGQTIYSHFTLAKSSEGLVGRLLFQKVEVGEETWMVKNLYGTEDTIVAKASQGDCTICYGEKADVVALPCRHLAIGLDCANKIRGNKDAKNARDCPVCRMSRRR